MDIKFEDIFEFSLEKFMETVEKLNERIRDFGFVCIFCLIYMTAPIWAIPYVIFKKIRERKDNEQQK